MSNMYQVACRGKSRRHAFPYCLTTYKLISLIISLFYLFNPRHGESVLGTLSKPCRRMAALHFYAMPTSGPFRDMTILVQPTKLSNVILLPCLLVSNIFP